MPIPVPGRAPVLIALWGVLVASGMVLVGRHAYEPGSRAPAPEHWPADAAPPRVGTHGLVLFLHPRCPCSRATLDELDKLRVRCGDALDISIHFFAPQTDDARWTEGELVRRARAMPGVEARIDAGGLKAARFGALTSGHALLYGPDGELRFSGGLTASRGHAGDNPGSRAVLDSVLQGRSAMRTSPVFGCGLMNSMEGAGGT